MSISHKSSIETIVNDKSRDPLHFIPNPESIREQLDLKDLSGAAGKSFAKLKLWQNATGWSVSSSCIVIIGCNSSFYLTASITASCNPSLTK